MKLKISHKLLLANLGITLLLIVSLLGLTYLINRSLLSQMAQEIDGNALDGLAVALADDYREHNSWNHLIDHPHQLRHMAMRQLLQVGPFKDFKEMRPGPGPGPQADSGDWPKPDPAHFTPHQSLPGVGPGFSTLMQRVALLDPAKTLLIAPTVVSKGHLIRPIRLDGELIGWVQAGKLEIPADDLSKLFFQRQLILVSWTLVVGALLAGIFSYLLSRHFTAPIKRLAQGVSRLAQRDFSARITVNTGDELQDLAENFNKISAELHGFETRQKQWLMDISHELRTPTTILLGELEAMRDGILPCNPAAIASLEEEGQQIRRLVEDLHELSVLESTGFVCDREVVSINQLIKCQANRYHNQAGERGLTLHLDLSGQDPAVLGDRHRLLQVFQNLLENCLRYAGTPGAVYVSSRIQAGRVELRFEDSGPGVANDALPKLFDRLYRTDTSRNRKTGGLGLGLAICKNIIEAHRGDISAHRSSRGGLCIKIELDLFCGERLGKQNSGH